MSPRDPSSLRIVVIQHVPFEGPGTLCRWAERRSARLQVIRLDRDEALPSPDAFDALVILGGPMSANDEDRYGWMTEELRLIGSAIERGRAVVGLCLGAQLMAKVSGARVFRNEHREIGWYPVEATEQGRAVGLPPVFVPFHWHGETFELPAGAELLASSAACTNQGFAVDRRVIGLQFHLEVDRASANDMVRHGSADLEPAPFVQSADEILGVADRFEALEPVLDDLLEGVVEGELRTA